MGHSRIYNNDSKYVIANIMDDVENVNAREYLIDFHAKSIYPAIEAMVLKDKNLDTIYKDPITIMLASKKFAEKEITKAASLEIPENIFKKRNSDKRGDYGYVYYDESHYEQPCYCIDINFTFRFRS